MSSEIWKGFSIGHTLSISAKIYNKTSTNAIGVDTAMTGLSSVRECPKRQLRVHRRDDRCTTRARQRSAVRVDAMPLSPSSPTSFRRFLLRRGGRRRSSSRSFSQAVFGVPMARCCGPTVPYCFFILIETGAQYAVVSSGFSTCLSWTNRLSAEPF